MAGDYPCAVGRMTISFTSTSAGCSIANAIARNRVRWDRELVAQSIYQLAKLWLDPLWKTGGTALRPISHRFCYHSCAGSVDIYTGGIVHGGIPAVRARRGTERSNPFPSSIESASALESRAAREKSGSVSVVYAWCRSLMVGGYRQRLRPWHRQTPATSGSLPSGSSRIGSL